MYHVVEVHHKSKKTPNTLKSTTQVDLIRSTSDLEHLGTHTTKLALNTSIITRKVANIIPTKKINKTNNISTPYRPTHHYTTRL